MEMESNTRRSRSATICQYLMCFMYVKKAQWTFCSFSSCAFYSWNACCCVPLLVHVSLELLVICVSRIRPRRNPARRSTVVERKRKHGDSEDAAVVSDDDEVGSKTFKDDKGGPKGSEDEKVGPKGFKDEKVGPKGFKDEKVGPKGFEDEKVSSKGVEDEKVSSKGVEGDKGRSKGFKDEKVGTKGVEGEKGGSKGFNDEKVGTKGVEGEKGGSKGFNDEKVGTKCFEDEKGGKGLQRSHSFVDTAVPETSSAAAHLFDLVTAFLFVTTDPTTALFVYASTSCEIFST